MKYPDDKAFKTWAVDDVTCYLVQNHTKCGYVRLPKRELKEEGYHGIAVYVPVHGGITYAAVGDDGTMVYGFDTGHCDSNEFPTSDEAWLTKECENLIVGLRKAVEYEDEYLILREQNNNEAIARLLDTYHTILKEQYGVAFHSNFHVNLNLLCGQL